jgi:hypothetical protein
MGRLRMTVGAVCATMVLASGMAGAQGILPDRMTHVTFDGPVTIPGAVLPAGEYMFRLADTQANRNVVQIFDRERTQIHATLISIRAERDEIEGDPIITFRETAADQPPALRYWFFAGERAGLEFAYPREQANQIARASGESVLAVDAADDGEVLRVDGREERAVAGAETDAADEARREAEPRTVETPAVTAETERPVAVSPTTDERRPAAAGDAAARTSPRTAPMTGTEDAQAVGTTGVQEPAPVATERRELPRTASPLPLIGLAGLLALGGAAGIRMLRRRV